MIDDFAVNPSFARGRLPYLESNLLDKNFEAHRRIGALEPLFGPRFRGTEYN